MCKEKACRVLELRTGSGELLFTAWLSEKGLAYPEPPKPEEKPAKEKGEDERKDEGKKELIPAGNESLMSEPRRKYLFRILAEQVLGKGHLKSLSDIRKTFREGVNF